MSKQRSAKPNPRGYSDFAAEAIINQLIQTAVQPRGRFTYQPYDETQITEYLTDTGRGVFVARGCRGIIDRIAMYLKNESTTATRSITLLLTPIPNGGEIRTVTLTQAVNTTGWVESTDLKLTWNYDSLAIIVKSIDADLSYAYYNTGDYGLGGLADYPNTRGATYHPLVRVRFDALSVGDIPVSGTVNVIEIPVTASAVSQAWTTVPPGTAVELIRIEGPGKLLHMVAISNEPNMTFQLEVDDNIVSWFSYVMLETFGVGNATPGWQRGTRDDATLRYYAFYTLPLTWRRQLRVLAYNPRTTEQEATINRLTYIKLFG